MRAHLAACVHLGWPLAGSPDSRMAHEEPPRPHRLTCHEDSPQLLAASRALSEESDAPVERALPQTVNRPVGEGVKVFSLTAD